MASLANQTISSTYDGLVKTSTDQPVPISGVQLLEDGVGNSLALSVGRANQGVTITGTATATAFSGDLTGDVTGDLTGDVTGDVTGNVTGNVTGDVTGNVTGNVTGDLTGDVTGDLTGNVTATSVLADGVTATTQATSDNSTKVATTAFVKSVVTAEDLDIAGDSGTGAVDLDSQTLTIAGTANEIETSASGQTITIGLPSTITANVTGNVTGDLTGTVLTAAQTNITSVGTLSSLAVSGSLTVDTNTLFVDAANNAVGIGTSTPSTYDVTNLVVEGSTLSGITISENTGSGTARINFGATAAFDSKASISCDVGPAALYFTTVGSERMRIDQSGNVGIGTSSPSTYGKFAVSGTGSIINAASTSGTAAIGLWESSVSRFFLATLGGSDGLAFIDGDGSSERMRILSSGGITFNGDTAAANALDDYEEGTWDVALFPSISGSITVSSSDNSVTYTKIGNTVNVGGQIVVDSVSNATGFISITLPYTVGGSGVSGNAAASYSMHNVVSANVADFVGFAIVGQAFCRIYLGDSTLQQSDSAQQMQAGTEVRFNLTYQTA